MPSAVNLFRLALVYRVLAEALIPDLIRVLREEIREREEKVRGATTGRHD